MTLLSESIETLLRLELRSRYTSSRGTQHMEGADLYLMAIDGDTGDALVYYEYHF